MRGDAPVYGRPRATVRLLIGGRTIGRPLCYSSSSTASEHERFMGDIAKNEPPMHLNMFKARGDLSSFYVRESLLFVSFPRSRLSDLDAYLSRKPTCYLSSSLVSPFVPAEFYTKRGNSLLLLQWLEP